MKSAVKFICVKTLNINREKIIRRSYGAQMLAAKFRST